MLLLEQEPLQLRLLTSKYTEQSNIQEIAQQAENIQALEPILDTYDLSPLLAQKNSTEKQLELSRRIQNDCNNLEKEVTALLNQHTTFVCSTHSSFIFSFSIQTTALDQQFISLETMINKTK